MDKLGDAFRSAADLEAKTPITVGAEDPLYHPVRGCPACTGQAPPAAAGVPVPTAEDMGRILGEHYAYCQDIISRYATVKERYQDWALSWAEDVAAWIRRCARAEAALTAARQERDKLQAFKDWVHNYLDAHGVPHHPPGPHGAEGCRIGDRMDWLMGQLAAARAENERLKMALSVFAPHGRAAGEGGPTP